MLLEPRRKPRLQAQIQRLASAAPSSVSLHAYIGCAATQKSGGRSYPATHDFSGQLHPHFDFIRPPLANEWGYGDTSLLDLI
jgi:hypothetical protein